MLHGTNGSAHSTSNSVGAPEAGGDGQRSGSRNHRSHQGKNADAGPLLAASDARPSAALERNPDGLRRALTSPWNVLRGARGPAATAAPAPGDRSAHALGGQTANRSSHHSRANGFNGANNDPSSRSAASNASRRSLFTVDGMPEPVAPDLSTTSFHFGSTVRATGGNADGSSRHPPQWQPSSGIGGAAGGSCHRRHPHPQHPPYNADASSAHSPATGSRCNTPDGLGAPYDSGGAIMPPAAAAAAAAHETHPHTPSPPPHPYPASLAAAGSLPHALWPAPQTQPPLPPSHTAPTHGARPPQQALRTDPAAAGSAAEGSSGGASRGGGGGGGGSLHGPSRLGQGLSPNGVPWDDARNPMSLYYNPLLDSAAAGAGGGGGAGAPPPGMPHATAAAAAPASECPALAAGGAHAPALAPAGALAAAGGDGGDGNPTERGLGSSASASGLTEHREGPGSGGGGGGDVSGFVVLDMKERNSPSVRQAAAAAFASGASASPAAPDAAAAAAALPLTWRGRAASYFSKWGGVGDTLMPADQPIDIFWSWLGAFLSIAAVALLHQYLTPHISLPLMIASFGASAVLLFGVPASKLAQPRNFLGGQVISAVVGVLVRLAFTRAPHLVWLSASLGMSLSLAAMQVTRTTHPPGGASALIASSALSIGPWHGFKFVLTVLFGCVVMLAIAIGVNNLSARRRYPTYWVGS